METNCEYTGERTQRKYKHGFVYKNLKRDNRRVIISVHILCLYEILKSTITMLGLRDFFSSFYQ